MRTDGRKLKKHPRKSLHRPSVRPLRHPLPRLRARLSDADVDVAWARLVTAAREASAGPGKRPADFAELIHAVTQNASMGRVVAAYRRCCKEPRGGRGTLHNLSVGNFLRNAKWRIEQEPEPLECSPACPDCGRESGAAGELCGDCYARITGWDEESAERNAQIFARLEQQREERLRLHSPEALRAMAKH